METNPYQSPRASEQAETAAETIQQRSWFRRSLGTFCFGIALLLVALPLTAPEDVPRKTLLRLVMGTLAGSCAMMGVGMFTGRDRLALAGFILFILPLGTAIIVRLIQIAAS